MKSQIYCGLILSLTLISSVCAQDDETRSQSGLPTFIGNRPGPNSVRGADATLSGSLVIQGLTEGTELPTFTVVVLANGSIVARQRVQNKGGFIFNNLPRQNVSVLLEADGLEVTNYQIGAMNPPPLTNRQDIIITWAQVGTVVKRRNEVLTLKNAYVRSENNEKLLDQGLVAAKENKTERALKLFRQILDADPKDFVVWTELASVYFGLTKYDDAKAAYDKALELKPDFGPALFNCGKMLMGQKKYEVAVDILNRAVVVMPDSADVNHFLGEAYLQIKKGSKAVPYLNKAIELAPVEKAEIHLRLAALYNAANLKDRAVAEYKQFLVKVPKHPERASIEKYIRENSPK